jgi:hypothetical protein
MAGARTGRTAAPPCRRTDAEESLVDKADIGFNLAPLKSGEAARPHILQFFSFAFDADDCAHLESRRLGEKGHEELGSGRTAGEIAVNRHDRVDRMAFRKKMGDIMPLLVCQKYLPDIITVAERGNPSGYGAGADRYDLPGPGGCTPEVVKVFFIPDPAADQQQVHLRDIVRRDYERHIGKPVLAHPLIRVQKRDFTTGTAGKLQDGKGLHGRYLPRCSENKRFMIFHAP